MTKVLVLSTSKKTRGGISEVVKLYEQSTMWNAYHCRWISTHRDGGFLLKIFYFIKGMLIYIVFLPFYDIVHIHFSLGTSAKRKYVFFIFAKLLGKKTVIHLHCGSQIDDVWSICYQVMFEKSDCAIVLSECLKRKIEEHIGSSNKICVIYNPCPIISFKSQYEKKNNILFCGTINENKGYKDLLKAFAKVATNNQKWKVVLAGTGEEENAKALAKDLGISKQLELLGWVSGESKHKAFNEAAVLCLPSYAEGFPMAVLDAWAYGLPVISTPVGGVPDVAVDGVNMLLFTPGDIDTLATLLDRVMRDMLLRERLAIESRKMAQEKFNLNKISYQVAKIYEEL